MIRVDISVILYINIEGDIINDVLKRILNQSYKYFELFVIDDSVYDSIATQVNMYHDIRILYIKNENHKGKFKSIENILDNVKGKYVVVLDSDDLLVESRFQQQLDYLNLHTDLLAVSSDYVLSDNQIIRLPCTYEEIQLSLLKNVGVYILSTIMFVREALIELYDEDAADYKYICKLVLMGKIENMSKILLLHNNNNNDNNNSHKTICLKSFSYPMNDDYIEYQINFVNRYKSNKQLAIGFNDVKFLNMGEIISYYTYSRYSKNSLYEYKAEKMLDKVLINISSKLPVCLDNGILGFACGVIYLIRNNYVVGEENAVLIDIDEIFFTNLINCNVSIDSIDWIGWLYYSMLRLSDENSNNQMYILVFKQHVVYLLDCLFVAIKCGLNVNEELHTLISYFHDIKIYPSKTFEMLSFDTSSIKESDSSLSSLSTKRIEIFIPLRIDSLEREMNLDFVLKQLAEIDNIYIYILEADINPHYKLKQNYNNVVYSFVTDNDPIFYRTYYINSFLRKSKCDIVGIWDTDVFFDSKQILEAIHAIHLKYSIISFPYDGSSYMLPSNISSSIRINGVNSFNVYDKFLLHCSKSVGGAFFVDREKYLLFGGENQHFYGWGPEDIERIKRLSILGFSPYWSKGILFHLYHPRKENSWYANSRYEMQNREEYLKICSMTQEELIEYISLW